MGLPCSCMAGMMTAVCDQMRGGGAALLPIPCYNTLLFPMSNPTQVHHARMPACWAEEPGSYIGRGPPTATEVLGGRGRLPQVEEAYPLPKSLQDLRHFRWVLQAVGAAGGGWWVGEAGARLQVGVCIV